MYAFSDTYLGCYEYGQLVWGYSISFALGANEATIEG